MNFKELIKTKSFWIIAVRILITLLVVCALPFVSFFLLIYLGFSGVWAVTVWLSLLILPLALPLVWLPHCSKKVKKVYFISYASLVLCVAILFAMQGGITLYKKAVTIDVTPAINVHEYLPFEEESNIVKIDSKTLKINKDLPIIDGAAATFPVYSAFVNATYPKYTKLYDGSFEYNNTVGGYQLLAEKKTDIFIGGAPSSEQKAYAEKCGTTFEYTQIGSEAFVFFVNKDNPIESLTTEEIRGIYSGKITNWSEVGGENKKIVPFQRNEGSGSQSMLVRFMGDTPIIEPDTETRSDGMGLIIEEVADYRNNPTSIGFSFRFYVEGIIKNPDIKLIAIDGIAPTVENIQNGTYPIIAPLYAVTYEGNDNENVKALVEWMLSDEGQYIITETGYVGVK